MNKKELTDQSELLTKAFNRAWLALYEKPENKNIPFYYASSDMQLSFIEIYKILYMNFGGDTDFMVHWFNTQNIALNDTPSDMCKSVDGLLKIRAYLEATLNRSL